MSRRNLNIFLGEFISHCEKNIEDINSVELSHDIYDKSHNKTALLLVEPAVFANTTKTYV